MLPAFLDSTYKRYKRDTSIFITWLYENAQKCGYKPTNPPQAKTTEPASVKGPRLKGKARKQAKQGGAAEPSPKTAKEEHFVVAIKELIGLADTIVESQTPAVSVPTEIIRAGLRAVSARKRCTTYFKEHTVDGDQKTSESNEGHSHIISVLEEVLMTLYPHFAVSAGRDSKESDFKTSFSNIGELENRFAALEVEEPADVVGGSPAINANTQLSTAYDLESPQTKSDLDQEKLFAIYCLFDDLERLRTHLTQLWMDYKEKRVDLVTAAATTNTAFQLAIRTQNEMLAIYPDCVDYQSILLIVLNELSKNEEADGQDEGEVEMDDNVAQWLFAPAHSILDSFCDVLNPKTVPILKRGHFGFYDPEKDRSKMTLVEQNQEDLVLLMDILPEFCFIAKYKIHIFAKDELTRGLCDMALTKEIPVWLTFATSVFLDIHHLLRLEAFYPYVKLQNVAKDAKKKFKSYFGLSEGLAKPSTWPKENEQLLKRTAKEIDDFVLTDVLFPLKAKHMNDFKMPQPTETDRFFLYKRHPILCGVLAFSIVLEMQQTGILMANAMGTVIYPAHFYNALLQKDPPIAPWPLMDEVIALHGEERVFVGGRPRTITDCFKQICLMLGYSPSQFARNPRNFKPVISKKGPRALKDATPIAELFHAALRGGEFTALTMHNIEDLMNEQAKDAELASNPTNKSLRWNWVTFKRLTPIQLLQALQVSIKQEQPKLYFDYFTLHVNSVQMLRRLKIELDEDLKNFSGPMFLENQSQLPFVGIYVVMAAYETTQTAERLGMDAAGRSILEKAGRVLEAFVREQSPQGGDAP